MENTLISTIYSLEPVMACITQFSPNKIILLREENPPDKIVEAERMLQETVGKILEIKSIPTSVYNVVIVAQDTVEIIEEEYAHGRNIVVNISGGRKPQALGALFGSYARHNMVEKIVYITEEDKNIIDLPILNFGISKTKRIILEELYAGENNVKNLSIKIGISRGMTYNHIRELREMGLIDPKAFKITSAGELAII
ncbi:MULTISPECIES: CRISPR-associated CARF protein Csa3 [Methanobacterium]|jgi:CRISPR-associated protein Csa3|uniref:CRISPR locus-related DNA-binding protein n=1 Tax=Methanobacterium subterraneum TaxID=59277 RepID=A0A2H4VDV4_9EURY|nr:MULTISPECIES: CRISPR-associated CARF protein Csa3 [Methanobacterium]MBW4257539.1 CRISPR locus-related DNA-binding protein [Methanobacterium sp. YSL]AUB56278.1 CRISPR-associated transcriptional regulator Csa3 [Methanobacterium subterraneum]AUB58851.1 CRISPR-associated transcriptional regulator Csa3 [Methanobacterium sp. MZ-A1]AUB59855.1 CRISPR-associated transcriptional regulator Csa3 [Methanobacterium subterraneum]NMO09105.1 CRISPR locus-related DNA-binding protein [Methanobacterium subterr